MFPVEVPTFEGDEMTMSSLVVYSEGREVDEPAGTPGHAFQFGPIQFVQMPGDVFTYSTSDSIGVFYFVYGYGVDEAGKPDLTGQYVFFKDGKRRGQTAAEPLQAGLDQAVGNAEIPLASFEPGNYKLQIKVVDRITKKTITDELDFIVEGVSE